MTNEQKIQRTRWGAVSLLVIFTLSFASLAIPVASAVKLSKQTSFSKTDKSSKQTGQLPFEGKEKEREGSSEKIQEATIEYTNTWFFNDKRLLVSLVYYIAPRSCGDITNLPLYLAKRVLLL